MIAYGTILSHEVVYGHHTSSDIYCHQHETDCCDHNSDNENHLPCLVNIDPHFVSNHSLDILSDEDLVQENDVLFTLVLFCFNFNDDILIEVPPDLVVQEDYFTFFNRSHGLRGPPVA